jgi:hypothetical protein
VRFPGWACNANRFRRGAREFFNGLLVNQRGAATSITPSGATHPPFALGQTTLAQE